jgi:aminomethyltransferase
VGLNVRGRSLARHGYPILHDGSQVGTVTSGTQSPTLDRVVAMGYVLSELAGVGSPLQIDIRGRLADAEVVSLPFYTRDVGT